MIGQLWRRVFGGEDTIKLKLTADEIGALLGKCDGYKFKEDLYESARRKLVDGWAHSLKAIAYSPRSLPQELERLQSRRRDLR